MIKPDFEGYDVTELILILQKKNYLIIDANVSLNEESKYEGVLILAVKEFQKDHGLYGDGIVGPATVKELMK
ncbi:MAG: peptidoglycan-binding protein [Mangrovibacterium sp.]